MTVTVFVNGAAVAEEELSGLQITTPTISRIFASAASRASEKAQEIS